MMQTLVLRSQSLRMDSQPPIRIKVLSWQQFTSSMVASAALTVTLCTMMKNLME
jgi:hypothetical protein